VGLSSFGCIWLPARRLKLAVRATIFVYKEFNDIFFFDNLLEPINGEAFCGFTLGFDMEISQMFFILN